MGKGLFLHEIIRRNKEDTTVITELQQEQGVDSQADNGCQQIIAGKKQRILQRAPYIDRKIGTAYPVKFKIAEHVVTKYIHDFDAVMLDAGSTAELIATEMFKRKHYLSIMTNNMGAYAAYTTAKPLDDPCNVSTETGNKSELLTVTSSNELQISGGRYVDTYESLLGDQTITAFANFWPNVVIIGVSGLRVGEGLFCHGGEESAVKALLCAKPTDRRLVATDWSKVGRRDAHSFAEVEKLHAYAKIAVVVTNQPPENEPEEAIKEFEMQVQLLRALGIEVDIVDV